MKEVAKPKGAKVAKRVQGIKQKRKENPLKKLKSGSTFPSSFLTMIASQGKIMKTHQRYNLKNAGKQTRKNKGRDLTLPFSNRK